MHNSYNTRKAGWLFLFIFFLWGGVSQAQLNLNTPEKQKALVENFLNIMSGKTTGDLMAFIAPSYIASNSINRSEYNVNTYSPDDFSIESAESGMVTAMIWGSGKSWVHKLVFKVVQDGNQLYLYPSSFGEGWIHAWYEVQEYVTESGSGPSAVVEKLLAMWVAVSENVDYPAMAALIEPQYFIDNNIDISVVKVNHYYPDQYSIETVNGNIVSALVWGVETSWKHRVTFETVLADGNYYIKPSAYDGEWIDPWMTVEAYVDGNNPEDDTYAVDETDLVTRFVQTWIDDSDNDDLLMEYIAPSYFVTNGIVKEDYDVNMYYPAAFDITSTDGNKVTVVVYGENREWAHQLTFTVVTEDGRYYLMPGQYTEGYIHPWTEIKTDVTIRPMDVAESGQEALVEDFLNQWIPEEHNNSILMTYIAPSYFVDNNIKKADYTVNSYFPVAFTLDKTTGNIVEALVWGENRSWMHRVYFEVVSEGNSLYLKPSLIDGGYIDPWSKVDEYIK